MRRAWSLLCEDFGEVFGVGQRFVEGLGAVDPVGEGAGVEDFAVLFDIGPEEAVFDGDGVGEAVGLFDGGTAEGAIGRGLCIEQVEYEIAFAGAGDERGGKEGERENDDKDRLHTG